MSGYHIDSNYRKGGSMITATIETRKKVKGILQVKREIKVFNSSEKARQVLKPIATDMAICRKNKTTPEVEIMGVSYDHDSEKRMLLEIKAIISVENEEPD